MTELHTIDELVDILAATEPVDRLPFDAGGIRFDNSVNAHHGMRTRQSDEPIGVYAYTETGKVELTRQAFEEICSFIGFRSTYPADCPAALLVPHLNYWFDTGLYATRKPTQFQFIVHDDQALAFTRQNVIPFSNLKLLDQARDAFTTAHGDVEVLADAKVHHDLRRTVFRLITDDVDQHQIAGERWTTGIQVRNSLTGRTQTTVDRYLYRWPAATGQIDTACTIPPFTRRATATEDEAYAWARHAMDDALKAPEAALAAVEHLTHVEVPRDLSPLLRDVFEHHRIPLKLRAPIIDAVIGHDGDLSMYEIMNAISLATKEPGLDPASVDLLMRTAGNLPYTGESRCQACDRLTHHH